MWQTGTFLRASCHFSAASLRYNQRHLLANRSCYQSCICFSTTSSLDKKAATKSKPKSDFAVHQTSATGVPLIVELSLQESNITQKQTGETPETGDNSNDFHELKTLLRSFNETEVSSRMSHAEAIEDHDVDSKDLDSSEADTVAKDDDSSEFVEEICLDALTQAQTNRAAVLDKRLNSSETDSAEAVSDVPCHGCGALLHCQDPLKPGYMRGSRFKSVPAAKLRDHLCERCQLLRRHNIALNVSVQPEEYVKIIKRIRDVYALTILIVDIMDMPNSLLRGLPDLIGRKRPVVIVGNKVDLIAKDGDDYLPRLRNRLEQMCREAGLYKDLYVHHVCLVSAKTGYGIEDLVTKLFDTWATRGHVYILGCTNVGKSTLYNKLLMSDYCKAGARDYIYRATTSVWPGTTLNLLQFPILSPARSVIGDRVLRLQQERRAETQEAITRSRLGQAKSNSKKMLPATGRLGQTFMSKSEKQLADHHSHIHGYEGATYRFDPEAGGVAETVQSRGSLRADVFGDKEEYDEDRHPVSHWCYDTPGVVNPQQIINLLNEEELTAVTSKKVVKPRMFVMKPSQVMFISGLGRLDYIEGSQSIQLAVFASTQLPVHVLNQSEADDFYADNIGSTNLGIPLGSRDRLWRLPSLVGQELEVVGAGWDLSASDIMFSSLGWAAVTAGEGVRVKFRAFTPGGAGCGLRVPSLLPFAIRRRGPRVSKTATYKLKSAK